MIACLAAAARHVAGTSCIFTYRIYNFSFTLTVCQHVAVQLRSSRACPWSTPTCSCVLGYAVRAQFIQPGCGTIVTADGIDTRVSPNAVTAACGGAVSGAAYWLAFYPADTVKSAVQTSATHTGKYQLLPMMIAIYKQHGECWHAMLIRID